MKTKDLEYYRLNADENYITTPISVLRYITELETTNAKLVEELKQAKSLAPEVWWRMDEQVKMINQLQSELSAAKERVLELELFVKKVYYSPHLPNDFSALALNLLTPKQHGI